MQEPRNPFHAELLAYRMSLPLPSELDSRKSVIQYWESQDPIDGFTQRVRTSFLEGNYYNLSPEFNADRHQQSLDALADAKRKWLEKYGHSMPEDVDVHNAETCFAAYFAYDGPTTLSPDEEAALAASADAGDFTLDMLWLMVEGLGWRPGVPVPENHEGWKAIWAEDYECASYLEIVRQVLGMSESPMLRDPSWVPPAVEKMESYRRLMSAVE